MVKSDLFWCKSCLNFSTRNRISFDERGYCNACSWSEEKESIDWEKRQADFKLLLNKINTKNKTPFDLVIPISGGKDGSYVTHKMMNEYGLNPLCVTVNPPLRTELGHKNLENFKSKGNSLIEIDPPHDVMKLINKRGLINQGRPLFGWTTSIFTAVARIATTFNIDLIMYGEDGEVEYGGDDRTKNIPYFDIEYIKSVYLESQHQETFNGLSDDELFFWKLDSDALQDIKLTHWSYYESWDSYRNYLIAKKHFGLEEVSSQNKGTYTNFAQNDTYLYALHTFLMYIKFGFGRCTQDVGIDIRRGAMTREQGIQIVNLMENQFPNDYLEMYLEYYEMNEKEFIEILHKHTNDDLFNYDKLEWHPKFEIT